MCARVEGFEGHGILGREMGKGVGERALGPSPQQPLAQLPKISVRDVLCDVRYERAWQQNVQNLIKYDILV